MCKPSAKKYFWAAKIINHFNFVRNRQTERKTERDRQRDTEKYLHGFFVLVQTTLNLYILH